MRGSESPGGDRARSNPDGRGEGGMRRDDEHACAHRCRMIPVNRSRASIPSRRARSATRARAPLAIGSSMRVQRREAFAFIPEGDRRFRRQRSEQYRTSPQTAFHFFLQLKGKPQVSHILSGKCVLLAIANHASRRVTGERSRRSMLSASIRCTGHRRLPSNQRASSPSNCRRNDFARVRGSSQIAKNARANAGSVTSAVRRPLV